MAAGMGIGVFRRMAPAFDLRVFGRMCGTRRRSPWVDSRRRS